MQIEGVKTLLQTTDFKLERIAEAAGFSSAQYLASLFHRMTSMTPGEVLRAQAGRGRPVGQCLTGCTGGFGTMVA